MKPHAIAFVAILLAATSSPWAAEKPKATITDLAWLAGTWRHERGSRVVTEHWRPPAGGMMIGTSHTVANDKTVEYEFIVLRAEANGDLLYVAKPSGQPEATFKLTRIGDRELVFENPQHDFPQRILYTSKPDGTLLAAIEGEKDGKRRRAEFVYRRTE